MNGVNQSITQFIKTHMYSVRCCKWIKRLKHHCYSSRATFLT